MERTINVFISSPSDVRPERLIAARVVERLDREFAYQFQVRPIVWEREPLVASRHFQDPANIPRPSESDIVVVIMWLRLGMPLPLDGYRGAISGRAPVTGTEWEFEDALAAARTTGSPDLLFYRKDAAAVRALDLDDEGVVHQQLEQRRAAREFIARWFVEDNGIGSTLASHAFSDAAVFEEQLETHLRALLRRRLDGPTDGIGSAPLIRWHAGSPFRGLEAFEAEQTAVFFGRARARSALRERLATQAERGCGFVLVVGPSGSGKSSLVRAGLVPDLLLPGMIGNVALCRVAIMRPSDRHSDLLTALAEAILAAMPELTGLRYDADRLASQLAASPAQAAFVVEQGLLEAGRASDPPLTELGESRLLVLIDQLEELFTREAASSKGREQFAAALDAMVRSRLVWAVATIRSDYTDRIEELPVLAALCDGPARFQLFTPNTAELGQIIVRPSHEAGLRFEADPVSGIGLDEILREAASSQPGSLPLLQFTLDQLWHARSAGGMLTLAAYRALGGLEGAIGIRADAVLASQSEPERRALPGLLRSLVTVVPGADGSVVSRGALLASFPPDSSERALIEALQAPDARLLVSDDAGTRIRVAHEALLTHWPVARALIADDRTDLELRAKLEIDARIWADAPSAVKAHRLLSAGLPLEEALDLFARRPEMLEAEVQSFIRQSEAARVAATQRGRRIWFRVAVALGVLAILSAGTAAFAWRQTRATQAAVSRVLTVQSRFLADLSLQQLSSQERDIAGLLALAALPNDPDKPDRPVVPEALAALRATSLTPRLEWARPLFRREVRATVLSHDRTRLAVGSAEGEVALLDAATGRELAQPIQGSHKAAILRFSPDDRLLAVVDGEQVLLRTVEAGREIVRLRGHSGEVTAVAFSSDATKVATASTDRTARVWSLPDGRLLSTLSGHTDGVRGILFLQGDDKVLTASDDGTARIWDAVTAKETGRVADTEHKLWAIGAETGEMGFSIAGESGDLVFGNAVEGAKDLGIVRRAHESQITDISAVLGKQMVISAGLDGKARLWRTDTGAPLATYNAADGGLVSVRSLDNGNRVATASRNGKMQLWNTATGEGLQALRAHKAPFTALDADAFGERVVTGESDGTVRSWATGAPGRQILSASPGPVTSMLFLGSGRELAAASNSGSVHIWDLESGKARDVPVNVGRVVALAGLADGRIAVAGADGDWTTIRPGEPANNTFQLDGAPRDLAFSTDGTRLWSMDVEGHESLHEAETGRLVTGLDCAGKHAVLAVRDDGRLAATGDQNGRLCLLREDAPVEVVKLGPIAIQSLTVAGRVALVGMADGRVLRVDMADPGLPANARVTTLGRVADPPAVMQAATEIDTVMVIGQEGGVSLLGLHEPSSAKPILGARNTTVAIQLPRPFVGQWVLGGEDGVIRIVDTARSLGALHVMDEAVGMMALSPDGKHLAVAGRTGGRIVLLPLPADLRALQDLARGALTRQQLTTDEQSRFFVNAPGEAAIIGGMP